MFRTGSDGRRQLVVKAARKSAPARWDLGSDSEEPRGSDEYAPSTQGRQESGEQLEEDVERNSQPQRPPFRANYARKSGRPAWLEVLERAQEEPDDPLDDDSQLSPEEGDESSTSEEGVGLPRETVERGPPEQRPYTKQTARKSGRPAWMEMFDFSSRRENSYSPPPESYSEPAFQEEAGGGEPPQQRRYTKQTARKSGRPAWLELLERAEARSDSPSESEGEPGSEDDESAEEAVQRAQPVQKPNILAARKSGVPAWAGILDFEEPQEGSESPTGRRGQKRRRQEKKKLEWEEIEPEGGSPSESDSVDGRDSDNPGDDSEDDSEDDSDASDDSLSDEDPEDDTVDVTLEFFDPKEADFLGLKAILQSFLDGKVYDASELVDTIIGQSSVGTVVKAGEDEDPIGVLSVLSTERYRNLESLNQIRDFVLGHCPDLEKKAAVQKAWDGSATGFLVSERLINSPPQLAPPLQQALFDEIQWATEDEPSQELRDSFKLEQFVTLTRVFAEPSPPARVAGQKQRQKAAADDPELVFIRPEDEFYHKHATLSFSFSAPRPAAKDELQQRRLVMLLSKEEARQARVELDLVVGNAAVDGQ